jgi:VWFA-related protein
MTRTLLACALFCGSLMETAGGQTPVFSSRVYGVRVDVLVTDRDRRPLRGLTGEDFEIRDNGVAQQIDVVNFGELPLNIVLALDLSESVAGQRLEQLRAASQALIGRLEKQDRAALVTFDTRVSQRCHLSLDLACMVSALQESAPRGDTALVDASYTGLVVGESDLGRSLLMVFSDGLDTSSWLTPARVLDTARRSEVVVYAVASSPAKSPFLRDLTALTGGQMFETERGNDLTPAFQRILDEFRYRYLITYTPRGVTNSGYHRLGVRVRRSGATVRARPGYQADR